MLRIVFKQSNQIKIFIKAKSINFIIFCLLTVYIFSSCSSYEAAVKKRDDLNYDAVRVYPEWEYKERQGSKFIFPVISLGIGAIYGSQTTFTYEEETLEGAGNAALWGGIGLLSGIFLNNIISQGKKSKAYKFELSQSEEWLKSFNKKNGVNYLLNEKELDNSLILVPNNEISAIQSEYKKLEKDLQSPNPSTSFASLQEWSRKLNAEYSILPSSEKNYVINLIGRYEAKVAGGELLSQTSYFSQMANKYESLATLKRTKKNNRNLYSESEKSTQQEFDNRINNKISSILKSIVPPEKQKLETIASDVSGLRQINLLFDDFNKRFSPYKNYKEVQDTYLAYSGKTESIAKAHSKEIESEIRSSSNVNQLESVESRYFANLSLNAPTVANLKKQVDKRKKEIIAEQNRRQKAALQARERLITEAKRIDRNKERVINQKKQQIQNKRRALNRKYGTYFPSPDDLFEILWLVPSIQGRVSIADENNFIRQAERLGFNLSNFGGRRELFADRNKFVNNKGYEVTTWRIDKDPNDITSFVILTIPDAKSDIINLYATELSSLYRNPANSIMELDNAGITLNSQNESPFYIKSGSTFYKYSVEESNLKITLISNFEGNTRLFTERLDANTLKVNSYSNLTDIILEKGDTIRLFASGSVRLGTFAGGSSPNGIEGFSYYNTVSGFNHGSLIGRIGEGAWFYIGEEKILKAPASGRLELKINDSKINDNDGHYYVIYSVDR